MTASDWIAVVSAVIAAFAFVVSSRTLRLQRAGAEDDTRRQFDEIVHQLGRALGELGEHMASSLPGPAGPPASLQGTLAEIQTLAFQAEELLNPPSKGSLSIRWRRHLFYLWNPPRKPVQLNWNDAAVLAYSFAQIWDVGRARKYFEASPKLAMADPEVSPNAEIFAQRNLGNFYYNNNSDSDLESARAAFDRAVNILKPEVDGPEVTYDKNYETRFLQSMAEDGLGNEKEAAAYLRQAWDFSTKLRSRWRRQRAKGQIVGMVANGGDPSRFDSYGGLPPDIKDEIAKMQAQQQIAYTQQQQMQNAAWQQGFIAAQQMFAAQPSFSQAPGPPVGT
jgi:hypothetical protein